jgi:sulfotransferase family protein
LLAFGFDRAFDIAQDMKARVKFRQMRSEIKTKKQDSEQVRRRVKKIRRELRNRRQDIREIRKELRAAKDEMERSEHRKKTIRVKQEILQLKRELRTAKEQLAENAPVARSAPRIAGEPGTGALPDFVVIGGRKCGTTFLYHLLTQHPHVERAAGKEVHFFNRSFDEGVEWYRRCFPQPRWKDGRRSITGEATPGYLSSPPVPERMAEVIPQARLIALLRNPVDRAYSDYNHVARKEQDTRPLEEAMDYAGLGDTRNKFLSKGIYVDHLLRWSRFFSDEQMLVLKSEDFFERPVNTLKLVLNFLDLPDWEPKIWGLRYRRNKGNYEQKMDPAIRRRLEEYFEPHNRRLYEYLGMDFGW